MQIQINAPHNSAPDVFINGLEDRVAQELAHHEKQLTRVEVHIRDTNAQKGGVDKRCVIEARPRGLSPLTAEHDATTHDEAFRGALEKLDRVLIHRFGKLSSRERGE